MRHTKLGYRIVFPKELRLTAKEEESVGEGQMYDLFSVVVHCGPSPNQGHYVAVTKTLMGFWLLYDDDRISSVDPNTEFCVTHETLIEFKPFQVKCECRRKPLDLTKENQG